MSAKRARSTVRNVTFSPEFVGVWLACMEPELPFPIVVRFQSALETLDYYLTAAEEHGARLWKAIAPNGDGDDRYIRTEEQKRDATLALHFYLISWATIGKALEALTCPPTGLETPVRFYRRHKAVLKQYWGARDKMEHLAERWPLGTKEARPHKRDARVVSLGEFSVAPDGTARLFRQRWNVGPKSLKQLRQITDEFRTDLLAEIEPAVLRKQNAILASVRAALAEKKRTGSS